MGQPVFRVVRPGLLTMVQDLGRWGWQGDGVSVGGAMDPLAMRVANILVGNARADAVLEVTLAGPSLACLADTVIAICGADLSARINGEPLEPWRSALVRAGQNLTFGRAVAGARACLAIAGGIDVPVVLGSRSTSLHASLGGLDGRPLIAGDILEAAREPRDIEDYALTRIAGRSLAPDTIPPLAHEQTVRILPGPREARLTNRARRALRATAYTVTPRSDRMGYRLAGFPLTFDDDSEADIVTEPTPVGTIQVTAGGQPTILLADRQTTGGYAMVAIVITADLPKLAQLAPGDSVRFAETTLGHARHLLLEQERFLRLLAFAAGSPG